MWRALASNMLTFLAVVLFLAAGLVLWGKSQYTGPGPLTDAICFRVNPGTSIGRVSDRLGEEGAVSNVSLFRVGMRYDGKADQLKYGSYLLPQGASMEQIGEIITKGGANTCGTEIVYLVGVTRTQVRVRELDPTSNEFVEKAEFDLGAAEVPAEFTERRAQKDTRYRMVLAEGVTSWQVVEALKGMDMLEGDVEVPPEGMLAPDNYDLLAGETRQELIDEMTAKQSARIAAAWAKRDPDLPLKSPEEMLVLASIIEKETGVPTERRDVASVFVNRLNKGMRLQTDPTVIYGLTKGQGVLGRGLRQSELNRATPWNTYVIEGLPPTPIANPGQASLDAAVDPAETNYVFFVADGSGGHAFAETLEEHNRNVAKWRKIEQNQSGN
ncbi:endolytic transglycosylase MltG [Seohaeicola zhoushanensis]|uniref:Endolytic murein transglycosylase n=1 Tax=Seohaeicola zhoushanensis TaxID=1569283 RepID=A0A8J3GXX6_9RHOB|nr:endolytic transglycosylase MltG [Seohaeicola zhoushanensis]GHF50443.1 branched-chain alpha-keto acid dehydrogenase subunit E2 [Seohaeicola zhoushanensis]